MTNNAPATITMFQAIRKSAIGLAIFAFFTAGIISVTHFVTKETITINEKAFEARQLLSILPAGFEANQLLDSAMPVQSISPIQLELLNIPASEMFYRATNSQGQLQAIILPVIAPEGYTEAIRLIVGISPSGEIIGVRVTKHKETPGLGDQVEISKSEWVLNFNTKSLNNPTLDDWKVKKDGGEFDQMTGATITPRAIVKAVSQSLLFFDLNRTALLGEDN